MTGVLGETKQRMSKIFFFGCYANANNCSGLGSLDPLGEWMKAHRISESRC